MKGKKDTWVEIKVDYGSFKIYAGTIAITKTQKAHLFNMKSLKRLYAFFRVRADKFVEDPSATCLDPDKEILNKKDLKSVRSMKITFNKRINGLRYICHTIFVDGRV